MRLFREILERVWKQKMAGKDKLRAEAERRLSELQTRKRKLLDAMLDGRIEQSVYEEEMRAVGTATQTVHAEVAEQVPRIEQLKSLLDFAEWILDRIAGLWNAAPLHMKLRIQAALFPDGITVTPKGFGTTSTPIFCNRFEPIPIEETILASLVDRNWNQIVTNLNRIYQLKTLV